MLQRLRKATVAGAVGIALVAVGVAGVGVAIHAQNASKAPQTSSPGIVASPAIMSLGGKSTVPTYEAEPAIVSIGGHPVSQLPFTTPGH
jgi:hypothetical protein